jgi:exopolysaccharide biosynthesis polyprenyl glycosylphosphotransferase
MLTEQKRYLYCLYLILSWCCGAVFGMSDLVLLPLLKHESPLTSPLTWAVYYLMPNTILLLFFSRMAWFSGWHFSSGRKLPFPPPLPIFFIAMLCACTCYYFTIPFIGSYILSLAVLPVLKSGLIRMVKRSTPDSNLICSVLIIGTGTPARNLSEKIDHHPEWGMRVVGFLEDPDLDPDPELPPNRILGPVYSLGQVMNQVTVDMVVLTPGEELSGHVAPIVQRCRLEGVDAGFMTDSVLPDSAMTIMEQMGDLNLCINQFVKRAPEKLFLKRCVDIAASVTGICLCLPAWLTIPLLIRMDSSGPILFRQTRIGKNGRRFTMLKFRSMVQDAESRRSKLMHLNEMDGPAFKMKDDPRVTKIGDFLRKTSLDELPQLFNVVRGDISLVGPRPPLIDEVRQYRPWEKKRLSVLQGITGLWQISGRNDIKFDEWMKLDLMYLDQWRLSLDLLILVKTIPAVIARKGAQ